MKTELIIIGGGVGGAAAALRAAQYQLPAVWVRGDRGTRKASRAAWVKNIDNMLGIHPGIMQDKVVSLLEKEHPEAAQAVAETHFHISTQDLVENAEQRIRSDFAEFVRMVDDKAVAASKSEDEFQVELAGGEVLKASKVLLSTGVMDRQPVVYKQKSGKDLAGIHWVYPYANQETLLYCVRCEGHLTVDRRLAILGSGVAAAEVALMVRERYRSEVIILTTGEPIAWDENRARLLEANQIQVLEGKVVDVHGADRGATLHGFTLEDGAKVEVDFALVVMGLHRIYNELAVGLGAELEPSQNADELRHVLVDSRGETSVPGLFAVGDMAQRKDERLMKQVYTAQEYAVRAVDRVDWLRRRPLREIS